MTAFLEWWAGKKTYFIILIGAILTFVLSMGWIDQVWFDRIATVLGLLGATAIKASIGRNENLLTEIKSNQ